MTATLEQLEARIAALEAAPHADSLQPNVLQVLPNGQIGALLTGGLALVEGPNFNAYQPLDAVSWQDAGGTMREVVQGATTGGAFATHSLLLGSFADGFGGADFAELFLQSQAGGPRGSATLYANVGDSVSGGSVVIINSNGFSSFMQIPTHSVNAVVLPVGTARQPSTTRNTLVYMTLDMTLANAYAQVAVDFNPAPTQVILQAFTASDRTLIPLTFFVPASAYYQVIAVAGGFSIFALGEFTI